MPQKQSLLGSGMAKQTKVEQSDTYFGGGYIKTTTMPVADLNKEESRRRKQLSVLLCASATFFEGVNASLAAPFFPQEADEKGLTQVQIGWVTAAIEITGLLSTLTIGSLIAPHNLRFLYLCGVMWCAASVAAFGWSCNSKDGFMFFLLCLLTRCTNGIGASLLHNSTVPLSVGMFPEKAAIVTAIIHASNGLGVLFGPLFGSVIYSIGGYQWPFLVTGAYGVVMLVLCFIVIPRNTEGKMNKAKIEPSKYFGFIIKPRVWLFMLPTVMLISAGGFKNSALSGYYEEYLGIAKDDTGYFFVPFATGFFLGAPFYGILVEKGYGAFVQMIAQAVACLVFFCFYLPSFVPVLENVYFILTVLFLFGAIQSSVFNAHFLIMEKIAFKEGLQNIPEIKTLSASSYCLMTATSKAIGSTVFGGYILEAMGYYDTCLIYSSILLFTGLWQCTYLIQQRLVRKIYYASSEIDFEPEDERVATMEMSRATRGETITRRTTEEKSLGGVLLLSLSRSVDANQII